MADKNNNNNSVIVASPIDYRVKYYPPNYMSSIILNSIEFDGLSWVKNVKIIKEKINDCIDK